MDQRAGALRVRSGGQAVALTLRGEIEEASTSRVTIRVGDRVAGEFEVGRQFERTIDHSGRVPGHRGERHRDREQCVVRSSRTTMAIGGSPEVGAEAVRVPDYAGFLARQSSELPNGLSTKRSQRLSRRSAAARATLTGAAGTAISRAAFSSVARPRQRCKRAAEGHRQKQDGVGIRDPHDAETRALYQARQRSAAVAPDFVAERWSDRPATIPSPPR